MLRLTNPNQLTLGKATCYGQDFAPYCISHIFGDPN